MKIVAVIAGLCLAFFFFPRVKKEKLLIQEAILLRLTKTPLLHLLK